MASDMEVIDAFCIPISETELSVVKERHSYIADKLILDAVNGVNVVARDFQQVNKKRQSGFSRLWDSMNGSSRKRQDLINEHVIEGVTACAAWLRDHDRHISRVDGRICDVALELDRTQDEILKFYGQHKKLKDNMGVLECAFSAFGRESKQRMEQFSEKLRSIDIRDEAHNSLDYEITKAKAGHYDDLDVVTQIYTVLDNLKSGAAGVYYDESSLDKKNKFKEHVSNHLKNYVSLQFGKDLRGHHIDFQALSERVHCFDKIYKDALSMISTQHFNQMALAGDRSEISDLMSIISSYPLEDIDREIEGQSYIRTFITYDDFIETAADEHLAV